MKITKLNIPEVVLIESERYEDDRGFFMELFNASDFTDQMPGKSCTSYAQDNYSRSYKGVLRGLHFQLLPYEQYKVVRCVRGKIFDVAVDIRKGSLTYGKWVGEELSEDNNKALYIPSGFAHGFYTLSDEADVLYKASKPYNPENDRCIVWNDFEIGIDWPIKKLPIVSDKDADGKLLNEVENNFVY